MSNQNYNQGPVASVVVVDDSKQQYPVQGQVVQASVVRENQSMNTYPSDQPIYSQPVYAQPVPINSGPLFSEGEDSRFGICRRCRRRFARPAGVNDGQSSYYRCSDCDGIKFEDIISSCIIS